MKIRRGVGWCARYGPTCDPLLCTPGEPIEEICNYFDEDCDGVNDNGVTCPAGEECLLGQCVIQADGGVAPKPVPEHAKSGCSSVPEGFALLALLGQALWPRARVRAWRSRNVR